MKPLLAPLLFAASIATVLGLAGPVTSPSLGYRADIDEATKKRVAQALEFMSKEMEFLEGSFINQFTNFSLAGSMEDAASCIWLIREVGAWQVSVELHELGEGAETLRISQDTGSNTVQIVVNTSQKDFRRQEFARFLEEEEKVDASVREIQTLLDEETGGDPEKIGRRLAKTDLAAGRKRIFIYGMRKLDDGNDAESGLPNFSVAGCIVSEPLVEAVEAYNRVMREAAKE